MKNIVFAVIALFTFNLSAQHTISGTFTPAEDYTWLIAYRLKPGSQVYVADTSIRNGKFTMNIPEDALPGTYRLVYAVPQKEYNFDVIYNGKENIEFEFDSDNGASYITSQENVLLHTYLKRLSEVEQEIIEYYNTQGAKEKTFDNITQRLISFQNNFEAKSEGLLAHHFITSNKPYIPQKTEAVEDYVSHKKEHYFDTIDFQNSVLQSSAFLTDKVTNYVFTALPLGLISKEQTEEEVIKNTVAIEKFIHNLDPDFKFHMYNDLWDYAVAYDYNKVSDYIYNSSLKALATETNNVEIKKTIEAHNRLRLGALAPEIVWKKGKELKKLSDLEDAMNYVLIFWSSTCGHCLKELPALHKELKDKTNIKVIAVGLEDDTVNWKKESSKLTGFEQAISLGKWDSEYADLYDIHATPTYYVLDKEKRIIAKPEDDKAVIEFLEKIY
tara:strand:- start:119617 stop:120942 length:1326 start_codon:yes stop_codon:yes gene_type:complete